MPTSVYFTFQFFNFPYATTERLNIYTGPLPPVSRSENAFNNHHNRSSSVPNQNHSRHWSHQSAANMNLSQHTEKGGHLWPGILYRYEQSDSPDCKKLMRKWVFMEALSFYFLTFIIFRLCSSWSQVDF